MLNIEGLVKITKIKEMANGNSTQATIYFGTKRGTGENTEWENSFFNAVLVGEANKKQENLFDKDSIYITSGLVKNVSYEDKEGKKRSYLSLTVFDFIYGEDEISKHIESKKNKPSNNKTERSRRR